MLKQVFGAYERLEVKELEFSPASTAQRAEAFQRFVEDANYQQLSAQRRLLGFPTMVERAIIRVDRLADMLIGSSPFRHLLSLGTKSIEAATRIPLPDAKAFESFTSEGYLPPIISLEEQIARAGSAWKKARPALIPVFDDPKEKDSAGELVDVDSD